MTEDIARNGYDTELERTAAIGHESEGTAEVTETTRRHGRPALPFSRMDRGVEGT